MADKRLNLTVVAKTDAKDIKDLGEELQEIKKNSEIELNIDDSELKSVQKEVDGLKGEKAEVDVNADDSEVKNVTKEVDDLKGENVEIAVHVDDSEIKNAKKEVDGIGDSLTSGLGSTSMMATGLVSTMAGKGIWDLIYGTSVKAETNKILLKNMSDTTIGYEDMYKTIDGTTDQSLISMQSLIPALNGIQSATGATGEQINKVTPGVAQFGQYVLALTGSEAKAETAMFDLSKGIKGLYASLDQYGITEEALMRTGLWSGKEDDLEGYIAAVNAVTGDTNELMGSTQGLEALMGKAFSRAGKKIGNELLPHVKNLLQGFLALDDATDGWLSAGLLLAGEGISTIASFLMIAGQAINGIKMLRSAYAVLIPTQIAEGTAGWFSISWLLIAIALGIALGLAIWYLYNHSETFRNALNNLAQTLQIVCQIVYAHIMNVINTTIQDLTNFWNFLVQLGQQLYATVMNTVMQIINGVYTIINFIVTLPTRVATILNNIISRVVSFGSSLVSNFVSSATRAVTNFINQIASLPSKFINELQKMLSYVGQWASTLPQKFWDAGVNAVKNFLAALGIHSPGTMQTMLIWEITEMGKRVPRASEGVISNISSMGEDIVGAYDVNFGNKRVIASIGGGGNASGKQEINVTFEGCMFDKRERVDEVLDILTNHFSWNNVTAGRTN